MEHLLPNERWKNDPTEKGRIGPNHGLVGGKPSDKLQHSIHNEGEDGQVGVVNELALLRYSRP